MSEVQYIDNLPLFELMSVPHKQSEQHSKPNYLRFCGNIMRSAGPNNKFWLTEATGMDANCCDLLNEGSPASSGVSTINLSRRLPGEPIVPPLAGSVGLFT